MKIINKAVTLVAAALAFFVMSGQAYAKKLTMNIGYSNKMDPETLIRLINKTVRSRNTEIGKINIKKKKSVSMKYGYF